jgi:hypothetical protein
MKHLWMAMLVIIASATGTTAAQPPTGWGAGIDTGIRCVKVTNLFPDFDTAGKTISYDTSYAYIYAYGNQMMYLVSYTHFTNYWGGNQRIDSAVRQRFYYRLVFTKGQPYGAYYNDRLAIYNKKVPADSILQDSWVGGPKLLLHNGSTNDTLVSARPLPGVGDTLYESWRFAVKTEPTVYGNVQLYFVPKRNDLPYSIDTALERAKGMTLCKLITFIHSHTPGKNNVLEITMHNEMKEAPVTNAVELLPYFQRQKRGEYNRQIQDIGF